MQRNTTRIVGATLGAVLSGVLVLGGVARAQVQVGDKITMTNADKVKDVVSPAMFWLVQHGWPMVIAETQKINLRRAFVRRVGVSPQQYRQRFRLADSEPAVAD